MVRQISRSCDLYTAKTAKAIDTLSGFSNRVEVALQTPLGRLSSIPTAKGTNSESEGAAASKGFNSNLPPSVRGIKRERGNCDDPAYLIIEVADLASGERTSQGRGSIVVTGVTPRQGNSSTVTGQREPVQPLLRRSKG